MNDIETSSGETSGSGNGRSAAYLPLVPLGMSVGVFFMITYTLCILYCLVFSNEVMYPVWEGLFPGFTWLTWPSYFIGLVEVFIYGWYFAVVFAPLYNFFVKRMG